MKKTETARASSTVVDNPSSVWVNEIELNSQVLRDSAHRLGLGKGDGSVRVSLESIDRRRIRLWALTLLVLLLACAAIVALSGVMNLTLPDWVPTPYVIGLLVVVAVLYGFYVYEKESELRRLTRFLVDEQFHHDVVNRRLKVVETILESSKAANQGMDEHRVLDVITRQTQQFIDDSEACFYIQHGDGEIKAAAGNPHLGLDDLARMVTRRNQSQVLRSPHGESATGFAVPVATGGHVYGALGVKLARENPDTFEILMTMALFAEHAAAAIASARSRERAKIDESRREYDAAHDSRTGLLNRREFTLRLHKRIEEFGEEAPHVSVAFFNIDDLQRINNSLGYEVGDAVIRHFAESLHEHLPTDAIAGYFGADEYMIALFGVSGYEQAREIVRSIHAGVDESLTIGSRKIWFSASVGIALPESYETNAGELIRDAHIAMQKAKAEGAGSMARFDANLLDGADRELDLEDDLHRALDNDEIGISLQPILDLTTMNPVGVEALVRWMHPEHGVLPASSFLPFARKSGQQKLIDQHVFQKSCAAIRALGENGIDMPMHVNLFPGYLGAPELAGSVKRILDTAGIEPESFVVEIAETESLLGSEQAAMNLRRLKDLGFRIALDDFGSGVSALESLDKARIDIVKISRAFIASLGDFDDPRGEMVRTIVALAERLELQVVAVGVETDTQVEILKSMGCLLAQGYYLGKPLLLKPFIDKYRPAAIRHDRIPPPTVDA